MGFLAQSAVDGRPTSRVVPWYLFYGLGLLLLIVGAVSFWSTAAHKPILIPYDHGIWLQKHPKVSTIIWTALGSILSAITVYLMQSILVLMSKQTLDKEGASLSTIELWNTLFNASFMLNRSRPGASAFTIVFWATALYLSTAYTTLLTPVDVIVQETMSGTELDFSSQEFWDWYNYQDSAGNFNRTIMGCTWYTYHDAQGNLTFHTCPFVGDPVNFLSSGVAAAQNLTSRSPTIDFMGKNFIGSTGGVLPLGAAAFPVFNEIMFDDLSRAQTSYRHYNYTISQQGLTIDVSCQETSATPITRDVLKEYDVGNGGSDLFEQQFNCSCPEFTNGGYIQDTLMTSSIASVALFNCPSESDPKVKDRVIYITPFDGYASPNPRAGDISFPNISCSVKPLITESTVQYTSVDQHFAVLGARPLAGSGYRTPNETVDAIRQVYLLAISSWGNMMIDSLYDIVLSNPNVSFAAAMEASLLGIFEFESSNLRIYYLANEAPGRRDVNGTFSAWRVGYKGNPVTLAGLLPPFVILGGMAITYVFLGVRTGCATVSPSVDPMSSTWLVAASATGGAAGRLQQQLDKGVKNPRDAHVLALGVKFHHEFGLVCHSYTPPADIVSDSLSGQQFELAQERKGGGYTMVNST